MARTIADVELLQQYIDGVLNRAGHHAPNVEDIALAVAGAVVWRKDPDTQLKVMEREGKMGNVLWVHIGGQRYALSYDHQNKAIVVRENSMQGPNIASFTNRNSAHDVRVFFEGL